MTDLTPDERGALDRAIHDSMHKDAGWYDEREAIWRAARAYQAEQDARIAEDESDYPCCARAVAAIRERAKGLT